MPHEHAKDDKKKKPRKTDPRAVPREECARRIAVIEKALREGYPPPGHGNGQRAALHVASEVLGLSRGTLYRTLEIAKRHYDLVPDWALWQSPEDDEQAFTRAVETQRSTDEISRYRTETIALRRKVAELEDLRALVFNLTEKPLRPTDYKPVRRSAARPKPETVVLFTSDFQIGEVVNRDELDGLNSFDMGIGRTRYGRMIERTLDLLTKHSQTPIERLVYLRGGDAISGNIHLELVKTNDLSSIPAVRETAEMEAGGLCILADELKVPIEVISIPGNHGRTTIKPEAKSYIDQNFETLIPWWLEAHFKAKGDDRFAFRSPRSGEAMFSIYNERVLLTHGDRIGSSGGQGFIGPEATILRGMKKTYDQYAARGLAPHIILVGHFHVSRRFGYGFSNGSLVGPNEYSVFRLRARPEPPKQWLLRFHPERGLHEFTEIYVGHPDEGTACAPPSIIAA